MSSYEWSLAGHERVDAPRVCAVSFVREILHFVREILRFVGEILRFMRETSREIW